MSPRQISLSTPIVSSSARTAVRASRFEWTSEIIPYRILLAGACPVDVTDSRRSGGLPLVTALASVFGDGDVVDQLHDPGHLAHCLIRDFFMRGRRQLAGERDHAAMDIDVYRRDVDAG